MKTREKILIAARKMYNEKGYVNTTTRDIAKSLVISPGNLHYHFRHSDEIIKELFYRFLTEMNLMLDQVNGTETNSLDILVDYFSNTIKIFYEYKFLFINFVDILKKIPELNKLYSDITSSRKKEYEQLFRNFQKNRIFRKDIPDFILDSIVEQMFIVGDNSISYNELTRKLDKDIAIRHYTLLFLNQFYFLLTDDMQVEYQKRFIFRAT